MIVLDADDTNCLRAYKEIDPDKVRGRICRSTPSIGEQLLRFATEARWDDAFPHRRL